MKGLLLKDWYMMKKYCRVYFLMAAVFIAVSFAGKENLFLVFYPCLLCGMIPVNLLGYDERSRWTEYSCTLPYTKTQLVSVKYLIGLCAQTAMLLLTGLVQGIRMAVGGSFAAGDFLMLMLLLLALSTLTSSLFLPFAFRLGVEKGRMAYYVMVGFGCAVSLLASGWMRDGHPAPARTNLILLCLALGGIAVYVFSWCLSVRFYKKREIR